MYVFGSDLAHFPFCEFFSFLEKDIVGIDKETSRLVFLSSASDFEENVPIKRSILRRHPQVLFRTDLIDGHVYVVSLRLAKFLSPSSSFSTLKGEFLPYVVSKQHTRAPLGASQAQEKLAALHERMKESKLEECIRDFSSYSDHRGDLKPVYHGDSIRCYAVVADSAHFGIRINSISSLWHANRLVSILLNSPVLRALMSQERHVITHDEL